MRNEWKQLDLAATGDPPYRRWRVSWWPNYGLLVVVGSSSNWTVHVHQAKLVWFRVTLEAGFRLIPAKWR